MRYSPITVGGGDDCLSYENPLEELVAQSVVCVSFLEQLSPVEFYLLGAMRACLTPAILLTQKTNTCWNPRIPREYQPRSVSIGEMDVLCQTIEKELSIFEEDYLEIEDQEKVLRYRAALMREGTQDGVYSSHSRDVVFNLVGGNIGEVDMSKDKIQISGVVGPVNVKSRLDRVSQVVNQTASLGDEQKQEFSRLLSELREALNSPAQTRPDECEPATNPIERTLRLFGERGLVRNGHPQRRSCAGAETYDLSRERSNLIHYG